MRASRLLALCALLVLAFAAQAGAQSQTVTLSGGDLGLNEYPVSVLWTGGPLAEDATICLVAPGVQTPGQVEHTADGDTLIWFLAEVPAGGSRTYVIFENEGCADTSFRWQSAGRNLTNLMYGDTPVLQYWHLPFNWHPDSIIDTLKPFYHVYAPDGSRQITKGPGGLYTHHRGIFFGYNRVTYEGSGGSLDVWHATTGAHSQHKSFVRQWAGPVFGGHVVEIAWLNGNQEFITEYRTVRVFKQSDGNFFIDVESTLNSHVGPVTLDGDNHHAGVQFRAAQYVADNTASARFIRPAAWAELDPYREFAGENDMDWNAYQFIIEDDPYTVAYFTNPIVNPEGIRPREMSERRYGRFGEFIPVIVPADEPLDFKYRFWITTHRDDIEREELQAQFDNYMQYQFPVE